MGGPTLEIFRMALYVFIPVGTFYYFNLPEFYQTHVKSQLVRPRRRTAPAKRLNIHGNIYFN